MSKHCRLPKPLRKRAEKEVHIFGSLFTDTAMSLAAEGIDVPAYENELRSTADLLHA